MFLPTGLGEMHTGTVCNELPAIEEEANTEALPEKIFAMLPVSRLRSGTASRFS
jgi:hypothetical protein